MQAQKQIKRIHPSIFAGLTLLSLLFSWTVHALEFRSISSNKAILYDAPSTEANKLYILSLGYPVEIIVNLGEWIKVRDHFGALTWVQSKYLAAKRNVLVIEDKAEMKSAEDDSAALIATIEKDVLLEVLASPKNGWVKVRHRDGMTGFISTSVLWGI